MRRGAARRGAKTHILSMFHRHFTTENTSRDFLFAFPGDEAVYMSTLKRKNEDISLFRIDCRLRRTNENRRVTFSKSVFICLLNEASAYAYIKY